MKTFEFEKKGLKFCFRNPIWDEFRGNLKMEWKIEGFRESKKNNGYYHCSNFLQNKNAMSLSGVKIDKKEVNGVTLPEDVLKEVKSLYEKYKNENLEKKLNGDIKYKLNDFAAYGIYNGISGCDIEEIVSDIKKKIKCNIAIFSDDITKALNKDTELKEIAYNNYIPYPMRDSWIDEIKLAYPQQVKEKKAEGYGIISNEIVRRKITGIISVKMNEENQAENLDKERICNLFKMARKTGKKQLINRWIEDCNDSKEECNADICCEWVLPDGSKEYKRIHTW